MNFAKYAFVALLGTLSGVLYAQSSLEFAVMGRTAWAAFECASLASQMKDQAEQERLFNIGYESGKKFLEALQSKKIEHKHISEEVPIGFTLLIAGPSNDFVLGRVFENAQDDALKDVLKSNGKLNSDDLQATLAQAKYTKQNCRLIRGSK
jgi:hypothetical protein